MIIIVIISSGLTNGSVKVFEILNMKEEETSGRWVPFWSHWGSPQQPLPEFLQTLSTPDSHPPSPVVELQKSRLKFLRADQQEHLMYIYSHRTGLHA